MPELDGIPELDPPPDAPPELLGREEDEPEEPDDPEDPDEPEEELGELVEGMPPLDDEDCCSTQPPTNNVETAPIDAVRTAKRSSRFNEGWSSMTAPGLFVTISPYTRSSRLSPAAL
jgi:hypothetical protein